MRANEAGTESIAKGMLAGLIGGLAGTAAKRVAEKIFMPGIKGGMASPPLLLEQGGDAAQPLSRDGRKPAALEANQWAVGAVTGAAYGGVVELNPSRAAWRGAAFGLGLDRLTHEGVLPAMMRSTAPDAESSQDRFSKKATYVVYGVATEVVRRVVRSRL